MLPPAVPIGWPSRTTADSQPLKIETSRSSQRNSSGRLRPTMAGTSPATIASATVAAGVQNTASDSGHLAGENGPTEPTSEGRGVALGLAEGAIVAGALEGKPVAPPHPANAAISAVAASSGAQGIRRMGDDQAIRIVGPH